MQLTKAKSSICLSPILCTKNTSTFHAECKELAAYQRPWGNRFTAISRLLNSHQAIDSWPLNADKFKHIARQLSMYKRIRPCRQAKKCHCIISLKASIYNSFAYQVRRIEDQSQNLVDIFLWVMWCLLLFIAMIEMNEMINMSISNSPAWKGEYPVGGRGSYISRE